MAFKKSTRNVIPFYPNQTQFHQTCLSQEFSIPFPIIKYIWTNPSSPTVYQKLIQCCKLFFIKNPILAIHHLKYTLKGWEYCTGKKCSGHITCSYKHQRIDMEIIESKIWLTKDFTCYTKAGTFSNALSNVFPKFYQCYNLRGLMLEHEVLSYNELKFFTSGVIKECQLTPCVIYDNGKEVLLEDIVKLFAGCKKLVISYSREDLYATCKSYDDLVAACNTVGEVHFSNFPFYFNVSKFYQCLKKNKNRGMISLFNNNHVDHFTPIIDEILQTDSFDFVPPILYDPIHNSNKLDQLKKIQKNEAEKYF